MLTSNLVPLLLHYCHPCITTTLSKARVVPHFPHGGDHVLSCDLCGVLQNTVRFFLLTLLICPRAFLSCACSSCLSCPALPLGTFHIGLQRSTLSFYSGWIHVHRFIWSAAGVRRGGIGVPKKRLFFQYFGLGPRDTHNAASFDRHKVTAVYD